MTGCGERTTNTQPGRHGLRPAAAGTGGGRLGRGVRPGAARTVGACRADTTKEVRA